MVGVISFKVSAFCSLKVSMFSDSLDVAPAPLVVLRSPFHSLHRIVVGVIFPKVSAFCSLKLFKFSNYLLLKGLSFFECVGF